MTGLHADESTRIDKTRSVLSFHYFSISRQAVSHLLYSNPLRCFQKVRQAVNRSYVAVRGAGPAPSQTRLDELCDKAQASAVFLRVFNKATGYFCVVSRDRFAVGSDKGHWTTQPLESHNLTARNPVQL